MKTLSILHVNDLHSKLEQWPKYEAFLKAKRTEDTFVFDLGDHADRSHWMTEATQGKINTRLLNRVRPDAVTIGNNEGITLPHEWLDSLYDEAEFPVVLANLKYRDGTTPSWLQETHVLEWQGVRIGLFGLTAPYHDLYPLLDWEIESPFLATERALQALADCDVVIALSHLGYYQDQHLAERFPMIDVILGAHTHHVLTDGALHDGVLIAQAGKYGRYVGEVELTFSGTTLLEKRARLHDLDEEVPDADALMSLEQESNRASTWLNFEVGRTAGLQNDWYGPSEFARFLTRAIADFCETDIAFVPSGVLLGDLSPGAVTLGQLHQLCPHPINPCVLTIDGRTLLRFLEDVSADAFINLQVRGLGFRGRVMGYPHVVGIERNKEAWCYRGEPLEMSRYYKVATLDLFTFGPLLPYLEHEDKRYMMPELLRDVLRQAFTNAGQTPV